jgi:hypothetical protein
MAAGDVESLNERELAQARSLHRPQNKARSTHADHAARLTAQGATFASFLQAIKLPPSLRTVVTHALALIVDDPTVEDEDQKEGAVRVSVSVTQGLEALSRHILALGKYESETAFLAPMYGSGEFTQAFCRLCAVFGGIYVLRCGATAVSVDAVTGSVRGICTSNGQFFPCDLLVASPDYLARSSRLTHNDPRGRRVRHRVSVLSAPALVDGIGEEEGGSTHRRLGVLPPRTPGVGNASAVTIVQQDESVSVCPVIDNIAPHGLCVLHLTTTLGPEDQEEQESSCGGSDNNNNTDDGGSLSSAVEEGKDASSPSSSSPSSAAAAGVLERALNVLLTGTGTEELWHLETDSMLHTDSSAAPTELAPGVPLPANAAICYREQQSLHFLSAISQAKGIFERLCPG